MKRLEAATAAYTSAPRGRRLVNATRAFFRNGEVPSQIQIRSATVSDIPQLVSVDRKSYGDYGADKNYFLKQLESSDAKVFVVESQRNITGFAVLDLIKEGQIPDDYAHLNPNTPPQDKWIQISAFTTHSNYSEVQEDKKLVDAIENFGKTNGYSNFGTCLSVEHPYPAAFSFWEENGYKKAGTIQWVGSPQEPINCYLYLKQN